MKFTRLIVAIIVAILLFTLMYCIIPAFGSIFFPVKFITIASDPIYCFLAFVIFGTLTGFMISDCFDENYYWK